MGKRIGTNRSERRSKVTVEELLAMVPQDILEGLSMDLEVDKGVKKLKGRYLFMLILYSLFASDRLSLRVMEDNYSNPVLAGLLPAIASDRVRWTGIRDRLTKIKVDFFKTIYEGLHARIATQYEGDGPLVKRYDSTMVASFAHLLEGMKVGNGSHGKTQVKYTTEYSGDFLLRTDFHSEQHMLAEETALDRSISGAIAQKDGITVFDRGLKSRATFVKYERQGRPFITRLSNNARYQTIRPYTLDDGFQDTHSLEFLFDQMVNLYGNGTRLERTDFRLVSFKEKKKDKELLFLTNIKDLPACEIAQTYRKRWDIEVLFRFLKQEMNLTHLVCNHPNAIQVMLYMTMIASMLLLVYRKGNRIKSYKHTKLEFHKELLALIITQALELQNEKQWILTNLKAVTDGKRLF